MLDYPLRKKVSLLSFGAVTDSTTTEFNLTALHDRAQRHGIK